VIAIDAKAQLCLGSLNCFKISVQRRKLVSYWIHVLSFHLSYSSTGLFQPARPVREFHEHICLSLNCIVCLCSQPIPLAEPLKIGNELSYPESRGGANHSGLQALSTWSPTPCCFRELQLLEFRSPQMTWPANFCRRCVTGAAEFGQ